MQSRSPIIIILPFTTLIECKIDFVDKILSETKSNCNGFISQPDLEEKFFHLIQEFNQDKLKPAEFEYKVMNLLSPYSIEPDRFWTMWNNSINISHINQKIEELNIISQKMNALIYLYWDTNLAHFSKVKRECIQENSIFMDYRESSIKLGEFPLYVSCKFRLPIYDIIQNTLCDILGKSFNSAAKIFLFINSPEKNPYSSPAMIKKYKDLLIDCENSGMSVLSYENESLLYLFEQFYERESDYNNNINSNFSNPAYVCMQRK